MILVDGILGALSYAFDRVVDKTCVLDTLSREVLPGTAEEKI